jgi:hypothetical protein
MNGSLSWRYPHFDREEFACGCKCGLEAIDPAIVGILEEVRAELGKPVEINSGTRCEAHNQAVGGAKRSAHLINPGDGLSHAVDIRCEDDADREKIVEVCMRWGIRRFEVSNLHVHFDNAIYLPRPLLMAKIF